MTSSFNNILVPVDFSANTEVAVSRALEVAPEQGRLHLFHVQQIVMSGFWRHHILGFSRSELNESMKIQRDRLQNIRKDISVKRPDLQVSFSVSYGEPVQHSIIQEAGSRRSDLIIIGKTSGPKWLPFASSVIPSEVVAESGKAVLTVKPGALNNNIKTIVIPVSLKFPEKKLEMLEALRRKKMIYIRLVTFAADEKEPGFSRQAFLKALQYLKNRLSNYVEWEVLEGRNKVRSLLKYCGKINADLLIVNTQTETRTGGWISRHLSDLLPADSGTQVLAVRPD